ncbi:MAG: efflux RND transporter permease subunit, partial [Steroidobacteraceae bacterium]
ALGVTAGDVSRQLVSNQVELPGGETRIGSQEQNVRTLGTISSVQELAALPITLGDGRNIRLDSIADVRDQAAEVRQEVRLDGKPVIGFQVMRAWGEGALKVADGTREAVKKLQAKYPNIQATEINAVADKEIRESFHGSMIMLVEGAILAIIVVWFFLRDIRATFISAAALPLSVIPTFWALHIFGFSMNTLTMLALSLVVGMLVDDAIVEVENNVRHLRMGKPPLQAATDAAVEIGLAVVATSLTLCAVFIPVAFMDGIPGQFFKPFGFTATVAVLFSLLVARALTPMMASRLMRPDSHVETSGPIKNWYIAKMQAALRHRVLTVAASTVLMGGTFWLATTLPTGFTPNEDFGSVSLSVSLPPGSTMDNARDVAEQIRAKLSKYKEVVHTTVTLSPRSASAFVSLVERKQRDLSQQQLQQKMIGDLRSIPGVRIQAGGGLGRPGGGPLQIELTGDDSAVLTAAALNVEREVRNLPGFTNVTTSASLLQPELTIRPRADRAAELGVSTSAISQATRIATSGDITNNLSKLNLPDRQIPIRVRLNDTARKDIEQIKLLQVPSRFGSVPLMNVADVSLGAGPSQITRYNRSRNISISADRGQIPLGEAVKTINNLPSMKTLPPGIRPVESGDADFMRTIFTGFALAMIIGIFCIYALLVLLFHDMLQPITILSALPPSAGGAILMLWMLKMELSLPSLIGLLTLMGIVTKNSILLVEYIVMARREHGLSRYDAIVDACTKRVRPIMMTTIAMVAGMIPITIGLHGDSSFRAPMGAAVIGGLLASTALSLFVVPVIYTLMDDLEMWFKRVFKRSHVAATAADT